jgi:transcription factor TGA
LVPQLEPLAEQQAEAVYSLKKSSQQAEDALSQGMEKLQQTLSETLTMGPLFGPDAIYMSQMANALGKLGDLVDFVNQVTSCDLLVLLCMIDCLYWLFPQQ